MRLFGVATRQAKERAARNRKLHLEALESRCVLSADVASAYAAALPQWFATLPVTEQAIGVLTAQSNTASILSSASTSSSPSVSSSPRWIVRLTPEAATAAGSAAEAAQIMNELSATAIRGLGLPGLLLVEATAEVAAALAADSRVAYVEPSQRISAMAEPNDTRFAELHGLKNTGQDSALVGADIDAPAAWDITKGSRSVVVGVIDSGIDYTHPDLALNIWINQGEIPFSSAVKIQMDTDADGRITFMDLNALANAAYVTDFNTNLRIDAEDLLVDPRWVDTIDTDANTKVDDLFGWDFKDNDNDPMDVLDHGTHAAGTIGGVGDNNLGVTGINWNVSLMALRFIDEHNVGSTEDAIAALGYVAMMRSVFDENIRVTNNSWGALGSFNQGLRDAIAANAAADILFVAGAGNGNVLGDGVDNDQQPFYPANYKVENVISVAATESRDELARFSNFGDRTVDIAAPGVGILSTALEGQYVSRNGTSMAAPHVTGVAALVFANKPYATALEVREAILQGADSLPSLEGKIPRVDDEIAGGRRLNALKALTASTFAPRATAVVDNVTVAGPQSVTITVTYIDEEGVSLDSLGNDDLVVTRADFAAFQGKPVYVSHTGTTSQVVVTYSLAAPAGGWSAIDKGTYAVVLQAGAVEDINGTRVGQRQIRTFTVSIDDPSVFFVNSTLDTVDANLSDNLARDAAGKTTLCAAVMQANATPGPNTIVLPDGVYAFNRPGQNEDVGLMGDIDVTDDLIIIGGGASHSTIDANNLDRAFDVRLPAPSTASDVIAEIEANNTITIAQNIDGADWTKTFNANVALSAALPHVSITGTGDGTFDYYSFAVSRAGERAIFDIDFAYSGADSLDSEIFVYDLNGNRIAQNDDEHDFSSGGTGSTSGLDSYLEYVFANPGTYVIGVGRYNSFGDPGGITGDGPQTGQSYTLNISLENHPTLDKVFTLTGVTVTNGNADLGGGVRNDVGIVNVVSAAVNNSRATQAGGGIYNAGTMTVFECTVDGNSNTSAVGIGGGGIYNFGQLTIERTTLSNNSTNAGFVTDGGGGGLFNGQGGVASVVNSTISSNRATSGDGGGVYNGLESDVTFTHATIVDNSAPLGSGGGVFNQQSAAINAQFAYVFGSAGQPGGQMLHPVKSAVDTLGRIYVADSGNDRIQVFDANGAYLFAFGTRGINDGQFKNPSGVTVIDHKVYVADTDNHRIQVFNSDGLFHSRIGSYGLGDGEFTFPRDLAHDNAGNLYVVDSYNNRIQILDSQGNYEASIGSRLSNEFSVPFDVTVDAVGRIYVADIQNRIRVYDNNRQFLFQFGGTGAGPGQLQFSGAYGGGFGIAIGNDGRIYVADEGNNRVQAFDASGNFQFAFGTQGNQSGEFNSPTDINVDPQGRLIVSDHLNHRIQVFDQNGNFLSTFGVPNVADYPRGLATDAAGNLYVADAILKTVRVYSRSGAFLRQFGGPDPQHGSLVTPRNVVVNALGQVYVSDVVSQRVQVFDAAGNFQFGFGTAGSGNGQFAYPGGMAIDQNGTVFVIDRGNDRVQAFTSQGAFLFAFNTAQGASDIEVDQSGNLLVVSYFGGLQKFTNAGSPITGFQLGRPVVTPYSVVVDETGRIYVAENGSDVSVFASDGSFLYTFGGNGNSFGKFSYVTSLAVDSYGMLFANDERLDRIQAFRITPEEDGTARIGYSVLARNIAGVNSDATGDFVTTGRNLVGNRGTASGFTGTLIGTTAAPLNPQLGPLVSQGFVTAVHEPIEGSPLIDAATDSLSFSIDQLGNLRPRDGNQNGAAISDIGAVEAYLSRVGGFVFLDTNGDGIQGPGEHRRANVRIFVDFNQNGTLDAGEPTATTSDDSPDTPLVDESGLYQIGGLVPGQYHIAVELEAGFTTTAPVRIAPGSNTSFQRVTTDTFVDFYNLTLADGKIAYQSNRRIMFWNGSGEPMPLIDSSVPVPGGPGNFFPPAGFSTSNVGVAFDGSTIAFLGIDGDARTGLYATTLSGDVRRIATPTTPVPNGIGTFDVISTIDIFNGLIAFVGESAATQPIVYAGTTEADLTHLFSADAFNESNSVLRALDIDDEFFAANVYSIYGVSGIYVGTGSTTFSTVATTNTPIPGGSGNFQNFGQSLSGQTPLATSRGRVVFNGEGGNGQFGIYLGSNQSDLQVVADTHTPIPDGVGNFIYFDPRISFDNDVIAFVGRGESDQKGIYIYENGILRKLVDRGDLIDGRQPLNFFIGRDALSGVELAFTAELAVLDFPGAYTTEIYLAKLAATTDHVVNVPSVIGVTGLNFGVHASGGEIHGVKFDDLDGDAVRDASEPGLSGWKIYLDLNNNQILDTGEPSTVTGIDGSYSFNDLATLTTYSVAEEPQEGWDQTFPEPEESGRWSVTLGAGESRSGVDFGNRQSTDVGGVGNTGKLSGRVTNSSGAPLAGKTVYIDLNQSRSLDALSLGVLETKTTTDANGDYLFSGLAAGTYTVRAVVPINETLASPVGNILASVPLPVTFAGPQSVAVGQFTSGDTNLDLVVVNGSAQLSGANQVTILKNNGTGQFSRAGNDLAVGSLPVAITTGYFNNDAFLDLAVANSYSSNVSILMGTGNASAPFGTATNRSVTTNPGVNGYGPRAIVAGDFNGDTKIDLAVANEQSGDISLLMNNGSGVFGSPIIISVATANRPFSIATGLFNGDTALDLVVTEYNSDSNNDRVRILLNDGSGSFSLGQAITVGNGPRSVAVGKFNNDNFLDLAVANTLSNTISILMGTGTGTFVSALTLPAGDGVTGVTPVDLDKDLDIDLVISNKSSANNAAVLRNLGNGTFAAIENLGSGVFPDSIGFNVVTGDVDGDQIPDVVLIGSDSQTSMGVVSVLLNDLTSGGQRRTIADGAEATGLDFKFQSSAPAMPGDYNGSNTVDAADYQVWKSTFGTGGNPPADGNQNGTVDAADYVIWRKHTTAINLPSLPGDYNSNNIVDAADHVLSRKTLNNTVTRYSGADGDGRGTVTPADYSVWKSQFGKTPAGGSSLETSAMAATPNSYLAESTIASGEPKKEVVESPLPASLSAVRFAAVEQQQAAVSNLHRIHGRMSLVRGWAAKPERDAALVAWLAESKSTERAHQSWDAALDASKKPTDECSPINQKALDEAYRYLDNNWHAFATNGVTYESD